MMGSANDWKIVVSVAIPAITATTGIKSALAASGINSVNHSPATVKSKPKVVWACIGIRMVKLNQVPASSWICVVGGKVC